MLMDNDYEDIGGYVSFKVAKWCEIKMQYLLLCFSPNKESWTLFDIREIFKRK